MLLIVDYEAFVGKESKQWMEQGQPLSASAHAPQMNCARGKNREARRFFKLKAINQWITRFEEINKSDVTACLY